MFTESAKMIRAELPLEEPNEIVKQPKGGDEPQPGLHAEPRATVAERKAVDETEGPGAVESEGSPMRPDSARFAAQPPAAQPTNGSAGTIACPQCGMENLAAGGRRFCGDCGTNLWEKCHGCGTDVPVDERFCGHCGINITESVQQQVQTIEEHLAKAQRLERESRFSEAKVLLSAVAKTENPRLAKYAAKARERLQRVRLEHERWEHVAHEAYEKAQEALSLCNLDDAIEILEEVPSAVRSTPMKAMLREARTRKAEVDGLVKQLRELLTQKRGVDALPVVERLQRLQPDHALAHKVATHMRDQLVAKAEERITARRYEEAAELLQRIPSSARTSHSEALLQDVDELNALCWNANHSQYVDDALKEILKRLLRRLPKDPAIKKLAAEYQKRRRRLDDPTLIEPVPWAATTKTPWKCPVQWMVGPQRIEMDRVEGTVQRNHPGVFSVAFGLALQGIGQGPVPFDFSDTSSGVMGRVAKLMGEKRHGSAWGIDIGDAALKVVKLHALEGGRRVETVACEALTHRKLLSQAVDYGEARDIAEETFDQFRSQHRLKGERLCLSLPGRLTICRTLHLPPLAEKKIEEAFRFEAQHVLPGELDDYRWRRYRLVPNDKTMPDRRTDHLLVAFSRRHMEIAEETFRRLGIQPDILQCEHLALHNYLGFEHPAADNGDGKQGAAVLLDMGARGTNMIVQSSRYLWGRYLGIGAHTFTRTILREFCLTLHQAEEWKRDPSRIDRWSRWEAALGSVFESFSNELSSALDAFARDYPNEPIERIVTVGGGMQLHGLLRYLRTGR